MTDKTSTTKAKKAKSPAGFDFEQSIEQLEALVTAMEDGDLSLEDSLAAFERGITLTRQCQTALQKAEQKVQVLMNESGATEALTLENDTE